MLFGFGVQGRCIDIDVWGIIEIGMFLAIGITIGLLD